MNNKVIIGLALVAVLGLGVIFPLGSETKVVERVVEKLGSVTGPDSFFPRETHNGVAYEFANLTMTPATTTPCQYKITATSTLQSATGDMKVGSTTALKMQWFKSTAFGATTTAIGPEASLLATQGGTAYATSSQLNVDETVNVYVPDDVLALNIMGDSGNTNASNDGRNLVNTGNCRIELDIL